MTLDQIVMKLVGPIEAVGETNEDEKRFENIKALTNMVEILLTNIQWAARDAGRHEFSMKRIGVHAKKFLSSIGEEYHVEPVPTIESSNKEGVTP